MPTPNMHDPEVRIFMELQGAKQEIDRLRAEVERLTRVAEACGKQADERTAQLLKAEAERDRLRDAAGGGASRTRRVDGNSEKRHRQGT